MPHIVCPRGDPPWGNLYLTFHIIFVFILSSIINHHSSLINHQSSIISHQSSVINHQSSMINDQSSVINYQSSILCRHSVINFLPTLCDQFFLDMHATSGQQAGNLRTSLKTLGKDWKASGALGKPSVSVRNCWKPSFWRIFFTFSSRNRSGIGFMSSRLVGMTV